MKTGIIITSRAGSSRVPGKTFRKINGVRLIEHLVQRCLATGLPVVVAIPHSDISEYAYLRQIFPQVELYAGEDEDPLARMSLVAEAANFDHVIRVTHDKLFIDPLLVAQAVETYDKKNLDYLFSSQFTPGSGFEIISRPILKLASAKYKNVEYVSYAIKNVTRNLHDFRVPEPYQSGCRFLLDYPEDLTFMEAVLSANGNSVSLETAIQYVRARPWLMKLNELPTLTIYTCAHNASKWIEKCMGSVAEQEGFRSMEYILVDDFSTDETFMLMAKMAVSFPNVRLIRNPENLGLASASNVALSEARGTYIMRVDADDYLVASDVAQALITEMRSSGNDAIYPNNYFGSMQKVQNGKEQHHIGGAIFRRSAINHVKFTEMLRGYEGYDFFLRAQDQIRVGYFGRPTFFYRQHRKSLSKSKPSERARIKAEIDARLSPTRH
jgi:spore coat polysaccharide biosynthesis protein SpsF (cytidylyltransferase family)